MPTSMTKKLVHGAVLPGFEVVQEEFVRNFTARGELGAACTIYYQGRKVVDLWGGLRDPRTRAPWEEETMVLVFSTTKGLAALAMALAHSQGLFEYDEPVARYWPEFAQQGKELITVRQLLAHQAGLCVIAEPLNVQILADPDALAAILARQKPLWQPGTHWGYHAFSLGWYESELLRRTDPKHRTLGRFFHEELAVPLGLQFYIGVPPEIPSERIALVTEPAIVPKLLGMPTGMMLSALLPGSLALRTANPRMRSNLVLNTPAYRAVEIPSAGGIGTARAIAHAYSCFATGGQEFHIDAQTLEALETPAIPPSEGTRDLVLSIAMSYSLGFLKPCATCQFGSSPAAFGCPGSGGSFGFADPVRQVGYAYVTNKQGTGMFDDPREKALRDAFYNCLAV